MELDHRRDKRSVTEKRKTTKLFYCHTGYCLILTWLLSLSPSVVCCFPFFSLLHSFPNTISLKAFLCICNWKWSRSKSLDQQWRVMIHLIHVVLGFLELDQTWQLCVHKEAFWYGSLLPNNYLPNYMAAQWYSFIYVLELIFAWFPNNYLMENTPIKYKSCVSLSWIWHLFIFPGSFLTAHAQV